MFSEIYRTGQWDQPVHRLGPWHNEKPSSKPVAPFASPRTIWCLLTHPIQAPAEGQPVLMLPLTTTRVCWVNSHWRPFKCVCQHIWKNSKGKKRTSFNWQLYMSQVVHMSATSKAEPYFEAHHQPLSMPKLLAEDNPTESPQVALDTCRYW
jgi:hypothetical protein